MAYLIISLLIYLLSDVAVFSDLSEDQVSEDQVRKEIYKLVVLLFAVVFIA